MPLFARVKTAIVGKPKATSHLEDERLTKKLALAVFSSDALSSSAYATEEILLVLVAGGIAATSYSIGVALAVTAVLAIVVFSYRQTIFAYPSGGGAYIVAHENLGKFAGLTAASALLLDYILTVAVSITAGVAAVISVFPELHQHRVAASLVMIGLVTLLNLRGMKEAGRIFAIPTYAFVFLIGVTIIWGLTRYFLYGAPPAPPVEHAAATTSIGFVLILKAFANGSTALTGVEAISNGVPAFKAPEARNAAATMAVMALLLGVLFIGLTVLARLYHVTGPSDHPHRTVVALIALQVFGSGPIFLAVQTATALILFLAANTSYADFPRLSALLARDRYAPRQLMNRGDKLAFSNGIIALGALAGFLVVYHQADVNKLIQLYVVGVFTSFTLSQLGMVGHWRRLRSEEPRWRRYAIINSVGAFTTFVALNVVLVNKFLAGAWKIAVGIPLVVWWLHTVEKHYTSVAAHLRDPERRPRPTRSHHVIMLVGNPSEEEQRALRYATSLGPAQVRCVHFGEPRNRRQLAAEWDRIVGDQGHPLEIAPSQGSLRKNLSAYIKRMQKSIGPDDFMTVIVPERIRPGVIGAIRSRETFFVKASLLLSPQVVITAVPFQVGRETLVDEEQQRQVVIVPLSGMHNATFHALEYARILGPDEVIPFHVAIDEGESDKVLAEWAAWYPERPLTVVHSDYRELVQPVVDKVREVMAAGNVRMTVLLPEFIPGTWWHHLLHNQSALAIKKAFLYEPGVVVTSVPFALS